MTVSYSGDAYSVSFAVYLQLLFRYRGSAWKVVYPEVIVTGAVYAIFSMVYRFILQDPSKRWFELTIIGVARVLEQIPISFILGFYVTMIYNRFWKQFLGIPYATKLATLFTTYIVGADEQTVALRRMAIRYVTLSWTLAFRTMNIPIKKRFPTMQHLVDAGLMTQTELEAFEKLQSVRLDASYFVPLGWCSSLLAHAYRTKLLRNSAALVDMLAALDEFRKALQTETMYDWVNVPLVYTQAVIFCTYSFFMAGTIGYQFIPADRYDLLKADGFSVPHRFCGVDLVIPVFAVLQLFIYAGLFKVAESLLNPHGENDDDFEICHEIDIALVNGYSIVTEMHNDVPELCQDPYWDVADVELPYTEAAHRIRERRPNPTAHLGSLFNFSVKHGGQFLTQIARRHSVMLPAHDDPNLSVKPVRQAFPLRSTIGQPQQNVLIVTPPEPCDHSESDTESLFTDSFSAARAKQVDLRPVKSDSPLQFADDSDADIMSVDGGSTTLLAIRKRN